MQHFGHSTVTQTPEGRSVWFAVSGALSHTCLWLTEWSWFVHCSLIGQYSKAEQQQPPLPLFQTCLTTEKEKKNLYSKLEQLYWEFGCTTTLYMRAQGEGGRQTDKELKPAADTRQNANKTQWFIYSSFQALGRLLFRSLWFHMPAVLNVNSLYLCGDDSQVTINQHLLIYNHLYIMPRLFVDHIIHKVSEKEAEMFYGYFSDGLHKLEMWWKR